MRRNFRGRHAPLWRRIVRSPIFEPALSVFIIAVIILSLYAYTDNWPPMVVIESNSMQHGSNDVLGVINTGDIVLVQKVDVPGGVNTYVDSENSGYSTYGEYGDVLLYSPNPYGTTVDNSAATPVIHRAIVWLEYTGASGFEIPSLQPLACSTTTHEDYVIHDPAGVNRCVNSPNDVELGTLDLFNVGFNHITLQIDLSSLAAHEQWSGFVTLGDNNGFTYDQYWDSDPSHPCAISCLVQPAWVVGVARGMVPWFGALKLWLDGQSLMVPPQSWVYLAISIVIIIALPQVLPYAVRRVRASLSEGERGTRGSKDEPLRWEEVEELRFRKEGDQWLLLWVGIRVINPHFLTWIRQGEGKRKLDLPVDGVIDLRKDRKRRDVDRVLGEEESITLDPPAAVEIEFGEGMTTVVVAGRPSHSPSE